MVEGGLSKDVVVAAQLATVCVCLAFVELLYSR